MPLSVDSLGYLCLLLGPDVLLNNLRRTLGADLSSLGFVGTLQEVLDALGDVGHCDLVRCNRMCLWTA